MLNLILTGATTGTQAGFVQAITDGVTLDTLWGSATAIAPIIIFMFIFAFSYGILRKVLTKGANKRKLGM